MSGRISTFRLRRHEAEPAISRKVDISLYDKTDARVGSTSTTTENLAPGAKWQFEAPVSQDRAARYEIDRVTWE